jgi:Rrf2 family protein
VIGIGRHTDYAARVILHLASLEPGALAPIAEIAARRLLPQPFARRIVGTLVAAGIVETVRGAKGGIRLARPAEEISLLDLLRAMEGGVVLNACVDTPRSCPLAAECPVQRAWTGITRNLEADLAAVRFSQFAGRLETPVAETGRSRGATPDGKPRLSRRGRPGA